MAEPLRVLLALYDGGAAKRARDNDLLNLSEEADARGWSSSVLDRSLALRPRRGTASSSGSPTLSCGWVAAAAGADELRCRCEEPATPDVVEAGSTPCLSVLLRLLRQHRSCPLRDRP